jgi:hypothetical protein
MLTAIVKVAYDRTVRAPLHAIGHDGSLRFRNSARFD